MNKINMKSILCIEYDEDGEVISCKSMYELLLEALDKLGWTKVTIRENE